MQIILRILLVNLFLISTSYAKVLDLAGVWFEPARAILFVIKTEHNQPLVTKVFTKNKDYCIADSANTESMRIKFQQAHKIDVIKDTMQLYELPTDYPNRVSTLFKLNTLPENCITSLSTKNPKINFDVLWNFYHSYYPAFKERLGTVTWRDLYSKYSGRITADMSSRALFNVMGDLLKELHDEHINLYFEGNPEDDLDISNDARVDVREFNQAYADSYGLSLDTENYVISLGKSTLKNFQTIDKKYLIHAYHGKELSLSNPGFPSQAVYTWGVFKKSRVGYLRILQELNFSNSSTDFMAQYQQATETIDHFINFFKSKNINKLVIDLRVNFGGEGAINDYLLQYLITSKRVVSQTQEVIEGVPQSVKKFYLDPNQHPLRTSNNLFPIVVLTSSKTVSAGEDLTLALKALDNVTQIGYRTNGMFASTHTRMLPNGWIFQLPFDRYLSHTGKFYEAIGIPPDITFPATNNYLMKKYNEEQIDIILEKIRI